MFIENDRNIYNAVCSPFQIYQKKLSILMPPINIKLGHALNLTGGSGLPQGPNVPSTTKCTAEM